MYLFALRDSKRVLHLFGLALFVPLFHLFLYIYTLSLFPILIKSWLCKTRQFSAPTGFSFCTRPLAGANFPRSHHFCILSFMTVFVKLLDPHLVHSVKASFLERDFVRACVVRAGRNNKLASFLAIVLKRFTAPSQR